MYEVPPFRSSHDFMWMCCPIPKTNRTVMRPNMVQICCWRPSCFSAPTRRLFMLRGYQIACPAAHVRFAARGQTMKFLARFLRRAGVAPVAATTNPTGHSGPISLNVSHPTNRTQ